ncbi:MAG TPA: metallophosphoesterase [Candidatus Dormibacteraeota bacterium]|nr:metallophosphoesterase [Candidatus Dormibacteraeota bacterium]
MRILAIADEVADSLYGDTLKELRPQLILAAGDLPFDYLENLVSRTDVPLLYVPGNHDPQLKLGDSTFEGLSAKFDGSGPPGCINVDGRIEEASGIRIAGLGGSSRYNQGPNQYTQRQMRWRARRLRWRARLRRARIDILLTHAPPAGLGDATDPAHTGFDAFNRLDLELKPRMHVHGHVRNYGPKSGDLRLGETTIINAIPYRVLEL